MRACCENQGEASACELKSICKVGFAEYLGCEARNKAFVVFTFFCRSVFVFRWALYFSVFHAFPLLGLVLCACLFVFRVVFVWLSEC